jgi:hypothetical protein
MWPLELGIFTLRVAEYESIFSMNGEMNGFKVVTGHKLAEKHHWDSMKSSGNNKEIDIWENKLHYMQQAHNRVTVGFCEHGHET